VRRHAERALAAPGRLPDAAAGVLRVRLHALANPRGNRALAALCEALTATETCFPGTTLRLVYEPPVLRA